MYAYHNRITTRQKASGSCCAAFGCSLRAGTNLFSEIKMIKFPTDPIRRKQWVAAIRRKDWIPSRHTAICSKHFISGKKSNDPHNPDYIPSIFAHNDFPAEEQEESETEENEGKPSRDPANPDYAPSLFDACVKKTESTTKSLKKTAAGKKSEKIEKKDDGWTSLLNLQPISSDASTSGLNVPPKQPVPKTQTAQPKKLSSEAAVSGVKKPKVKAKSVQQRKRHRSPSPTPSVPTVMSTDDSKKLCIVKMEIEDDGYTNNEDESFLASLTPSSSQKSQDGTLDISITSSLSLKAELNIGETPNINEPIDGAASLTNGDEQVEDFFKNIATTVMQFPPHLIEETKTKVSSLVYEMVIRAINEGCNSITQQEL